MMPESSPRTFHARRRAILVLAVALCGASLASADATDARADDDVLVQEPFEVQGTPFDPRETLQTRIEFETDAPLADRDWRMLARETPNLFVAAGGAGAYGDTFAIRGLGNTPYFGDPAVAVYLGDLALGSGFTYPTNLSSFAGATLAKGPIGTRLGRAGTAGTLVLHPAEPGDAPAATLRVGAGRFGMRSVALDASTAHGRSVDATFNLWHEQHDGFLRNTLLDTRVDERESTGGLAHVRFHPGNRVELGLQLFVQRLRAGSQPLVPLGAPLREVSRTREGSTGVDNLGLAFTGAFDAGPVRITAITNFSRWELDPYDSHIVLPPAIDSTLRQEQSTWSEEIRITPVAVGSVEWTAGLWLASSETDGGVLRELTGLFPIEGSGFEMEARTAAVFGEAEFSLAPGWRLTTGLRAERNRKSIVREETIPTSGRFEAENTRSHLEARAVLAHDLSESTMLHLSVASASKPGGFSAFTGNRTLARFDAEGLLAVDSGLRFARADGSLTLEAGAFAWFIRDYQIERSFTQTDYIVVNAPNARSLGAEASASWEPAPGWTVRASVGVTSTTLRQFTDPFTGDVYDGNRAPFAPAATASLQIAYRSASGWFAAADASFTGRTHFDESEAQQFAQSSFTVLGARAGYQRRGWRVALYGTNLADTDYYSLIVPGVWHGVPGSPRSLGVEIALEF